jgi:hypothetical protein
MSANDDLLAKNVRYGLEVLNKAIEAAVAVGIRVEVEIVRGPSMYSGDGTNVRATPRVAAMISKPL